MPDHRLDGRTAPEGALEGAREPALLARPGDPEALLFRRRVALRAGIGDDPRELGPDRRLDRGDHAGPRGPVIRSAGQRLHLCPELPAPAAPERGRDAPLDAELVGLRGLALADALDLGRVQGRDLAAPLTLALVLDAPGQRQRPGEGLGAVGAHGDLAGNVPDHPPEPRAQAPERLVGPLEWLGVGLALGRDQQALADPGRGRAQGNAVRLGEPDQTFSRPVHQLGVGREGEGLLLDRGVDDPRPEVGRLGGT